MNADLTPVQRLAISRARLADSVHDPIWLILLQRWLQAKAKTTAQPTQRERNTRR
ncbi:hypothetical protein [Limnohabitans sp. Jir72]|uniref:hypothetical protein n=1 Tax=Limnohabitans sp. Jir72 TaxID=1977909 RepID=UPI001304DB19|nr:hypothetical protein [Limnohabitans sp. Jir72]